MKQSINALLSVLTLTFFVTACGQDKPSVSAPAADEVSNAPVVPELNSRVTYQGSKVGLKSSGEERAIQGDGKKDEVEFEYLVSASAPKGPISGELLQATNFDFAGKYGFVSYNTAGEIIEGALDIVIVEKKSYVDIKASLLFENAEFADVKVEGEFAYLVGAQSGAEEGAVLVVVDLSDPSMPAIKEVYKLENALSISEVKGTLYTLGGYDGTFLFNDLSFESRWDISKDRSDAPSRMASDEHSIYINAQHSGLFFRPRPAGADRLAPGSRLRGGSIAKVCFKSGFQCQNRRYYVNSSIPYSSHRPKTGGRSSDPPKK